MGRRGLGPTTAAALVVASMIGSGVFTTSGFALADLGDPRYVLWAWVLGGLFATCGALCYGSLARAMPESGGEYHFLRELVHPLAGFLAGWISLFAGFTAPIAAAALCLQEYLGPVVDLGVSTEWLGTAAIVLAALLHGVQRQHGVVVQNAAVGIKLLLIVGFIVIGSTRIEPLADAATASGPSGGFLIATFAVSLVWVSFSYSGWNAAVYVAGEVRRPERNLHRSLLFGTLVVTVLYVALNALFVYAAPVDELAGRADIGAVAAGALGGEWMANAVRALVAFASWTSISAMIMAGPRVYAKMAEDGLFPRIAGSFHGATTPRAAVAIQAGLAIIVVWVSDLAELLGYIGFTLGLCSAATVLALIRLRHREGPKRVPVFGYPFTPLVYVLGTLGAAGFMAFRRPGESAAALGTVLLGVVIYFVRRRKKSARED